MSKKTLICNCEPDDMPHMFRLYDIAREYQKERSNRHWQSFDPLLIQEEIAEQRQWKILEDGAIACVFMTAYQDPHIWGEKNRDPAVYIHRIVTDPAYHGNNYTLKIVDWAKEHARASGKKYLRMDTWGDNQKLTDYYIKCGFNFLGVITPVNTDQLPKHYSCISLSLLEIEID